MAVLAAGKGARSMQSGEGNLFHIGAGESGCQHAEAMTLDLATRECTEINWERGKTKMQELKSHNSEGIGGKLLDAARGIAFSGKAQATKAKADKGGNWMVSAEQRRPSGE